VQINNNVKYRCDKSGKKNVWRAIGRIATSTPALVPESPTNQGSSNNESSSKNPLVSVSAPKAYPKNIGTLNLPATTQVTSFELPDKVQSAPAGTNTKLWIYDPENTKTKAGSPGIFMAPSGGAWKFVPANSDGSLYLTLAQGSYSIDVVEPNSVRYLRKRYTASVNPSGIFSIEGLASNQAGYFTVTVDLQPISNGSVDAIQKKLTDLANLPVSSFSQTSPCQLLDQVTPNRSFSVDLSAGFPKVAVRLPSTGNIKALIVPVDFSDIKGIDDPLSYYGKIATGVSTFYYKQSYGKLAFDFDVVPSWIHAPFSSTKYGTGGAVGNGDPSGYLKALIALTDGPIDYSSYDAVYFLVPKEMPMSSMGWGPAITSPHWLKNGVIINGATGGADMYYAENNGIVGGTWKWMAHETGHAFGLYDEDLNHASQTLGYWSIMAMSWSNHAIEMGAWDRYLQGWLPEKQINCVTMPSLSSEGITSKISPIVRMDSELKSIMVPISSSKILVIESRKNESLDNLPADREGVLVYTVDMKKGQLGGGYEVQKRVGSVDSNFEDAALHIGDSISVSGLRISVLDSNASGDTVKVSRI
jgi:M6 family metalloprotease-like protein